MNVLFISQCDKRALTESRRILDQFAERRGDRSWQTPITQAGLETVRRLLRKTARKNTAVACHWIRGLDHSELLWVVGDAGRFNADGAVPTNTTTRNVLRSEDENDWHSGELMRLLVDMAGLLHDLGKSIDAFQQRLAGKLSGKNLVRHEWVSLRMFEAFVGHDGDAAWLTRLAEPTAADDASWITRLQRDGLDGAVESPFKRLRAAPLAQALGWLVLTHHRLPEFPEKNTDLTTALPGLLERLEPSWNERAFSKDDADALKPFWKFPKGGLPMTTDAWRQRASRIARRLLALLQAKPLESPLDNPFLMHLSRLSLMLADHHYSSLEGAHAERVKITPGNRLLANTCKDGSANQPLDEHLIGVAQHGAEVAKFLPRFARYLPPLGNRKLLKQRATDERFRWQNKAAELAASMRERSVQQGAFIVNMASTGCGKTLANARTMHALADPVQGMRCAFAMGLRTLTLQTGQAFRQMLGLDDEALAICVGGSANRALFEHYEAQAEKTGSASRQALLEEDGYVQFDGATDQHPLLRRAVADPQVRKLLLAPLLVCTIDHLTPATESQRGGRQIAPMLRLMSGDLVLDEPDDFDLADLPALTRLVHWAGLLGARVLLSSATLPPALVQGLFEAYRNGRQHFQRNCAARPSAADAAPAICCAWVDEFHQQQQDCTDATSFEQAHAQFAQRRAGELARQASEARRHAVVLPLLSQGLAAVGKKDWHSLAQVFAPQVLNTAISLHHAHHSIDPVSQKRVSFGLVRMANIEPLFEVALALFRQTLPANLRVHLCVYHSRHPLLVRSAIEQQLDQSLRRHQPDAVFALPDIRQRLDAAPESDQLFIVLGSPVTEVGRDHDYDWAVVEPSSMRSLIQLAGRVRRHRPGAVASPNIHVFSHNLRHFHAPGKAAFCMPGFEANEGRFHLNSHDLNQLLGADELSAIDARPRIVSPAPEALQPQQRLVDLEHARMRSEMLPQSTSPSAPLSAPVSAAPKKLMSTRERALAAQTAASPPPVLNASTWWNQPPRDALLTAVLPQKYPFRQEAEPREVTLVLLPDEDEENAKLHQVMDGPLRWQNLYVEVDKSLCTHLDEANVNGPQISPWGVTDYLQALGELAAALDLTPRQCAERFGVVSVPPNEKGWRYHPTLGFTKRR